MRLQIGNYKMSMDNWEVAAGLSVVGAAVVGALGAYAIKPIFKSLSPVGIALTCGVTTAIGIGLLFSRSDFTSKFFGFMAAYPIGLMVSNLMGCRVRVLDPAVSIFVGGIIITPMVLTALFFSAVS